MFRESRASLLIELLHLNQVNPKDLAACPASGSSRLDSRLLRAIFSDLEYDSAPPSIKPGQQSFGEVANGRR